MHVILSPPKKHPPHLFRLLNVKMVHYLLNCTAPLMQHEKSNGKERRVE